MSQYPYQPPHDAPYGYGYPQQDPMAVLLAPARRASIFMFILSGLMIPCGLLFGVLSLTVSKVDFSQMPAETQKQFHQMEEQFAKAGLTLAGGMQAFAAFVLIPGVILLVLAVLVRRGGMGSAVASIIVCCLMALVVGLQVLGGVASGQPQMLAGACVFGVVLLLFIAAIVSLFSAARNAGQIASYRAQYPSQMGQQHPQGSAPYYPSQQPQNWQQPAPGQWPGQPAWPPQPPQGPTPQPPPQIWPPPPPPPPPPSNPT